MAPRNEYPKEFETFWSAYPTRSGGNPKFTAFREWKKVRRKYSAGDLTAAAQRFAQSPDLDGLDPKFLPHTRTWLSQGRFVDYLPTDSALDETAKEGVPAPDERWEAFQLAGMSEADYRNWIAPLNFEGAGCATVRIKVRPFVKTWLMGRLKAAFVAGLKNMGYTKIDWEDGSC
ncbi:MAG: hypothetical protein ACPGOY_07055 [Rhodospirillaceae bacterium]